MKNLLKSRNAQAESETRKNRKKLFLLLKRHCMVVLFILISANLYSQDIRQLDSFLEQAKVSTDPVLVSEAKHIESLIKELQPTIYINNTIIDNNGIQPKCAEVDAGSTIELNKENILYNEVELITVKLTTPDDLNFIIDLSKLTGFTNLKSILFLCEFECSIESIQKLYIPKTGINIFIKVSIPS